MLTFITMGLVFSGIVFLFVNHFVGTKRNKSLQEQLKDKPYRILYQEATKLFFVEEAAIFPPVLHLPAHIYWTERVRNESRLICDSWITGELAKQEPKVEVWP